MENYPHDASGRPSSASSINNAPSHSPYRDDQESLSQPFSPTGLLGERYDVLKQQMEARSRIAKQRDSPFTRGLLGSLAESETSGHRASYDGKGAAGLSRTMSTPPNRPGPRRAPSVSSVRTDSMYCAQSGVTPPPLLDISSYLPQRRHSLADRNSQAVRSPTGRLLSLAETSTTQWDNTYPPSLGRSHSVAVRSSRGSWGPSGSKPNSRRNEGEQRALSRRVSTATAPARHETWYQVDRSEPKRRGTLRTC
ncbi:hypothetical protein FBEOM_4528 [Fusarium beomiforme]|uniref:Uncharacterized protein n=1 Tax=Fusarium beomiforme TaxID=44412 RepID=A0A9P5AMS0_9HYPO|nr:hypothetical protein FBEOM_4528 [Fusarium beomiforme]